MKEIKVFAITDVGMVRSNNEDHYLLKEYDDMVVAAVADGMGGAAHGEVASRIAVETIEKIFERKRENNEIEKLIEEGLLQSHRKIREEGLRRHGNLNMGTTCTLVAVIPKTGMPGTGRTGGSSSGNSYTLQAYVGHIGDSRVYLIQREAITQKSVDHTIVQKLMDVGALKPSETNHFAHKGVIYKSLGGSEKLNMDSVQQFSFRKGNVLLLCSDGFSNYITPEEMVRVLRAKTDLEQAGRYMVDWVKYRGGDDNITVVLLEFGRYPRKRNIELEEIPTLS